MHLPHVLRGATCEPLQSSITSGLGCRQSKRRRTRLVLLGLATSDFGKKMSHSVGLGPFFVFFCQCLVAVGGLNVLQFFLGRFFFANHLFFPSVFFVCAGGHSNLAFSPCVHGISCADCQNKALYTWICLRWCFAFYRYSPTARFVLLRCMGEVEPRLIPVFEGNSDAGQDLKIQSIQGTPKIHVCFARNTNANGMLATLHYLWFQWVYGRPVEIDWTRDAVSRQSCILARARSNYWRNWRLCREGCCMLTVQH